jgi:CRISPR/Cas system-associated endonuclease Cas1
VAFVAGQVYRASAKTGLGALAAEFTARVHPMQALQNYATGIVTARMTRVVIARGMEPCFGFLHDGRKPGLIWDCVEPFRPELVRAVFGFAGGRAFKKADFAVIAGGIVRLTDELRREIAEVVIGKFSITRYMEAVKVVERKL